MAFVDDWPPPRSAGQRNLRVFLEGTAASGSDFDTTGNNSLWANEDPGYVDSAAIPNGKGATTTQVSFGSYDKPGPPVGGGAPQNPINRTDSGAIPNAAPKTPAFHAQNIRIFNDESAGSGNDLEFSFDGTNVHGKVLAGEVLEYEDRREAGIAIRPASTGAFTVAYRIEVW